MSLPKTRIGPSAWARLAGTTVLATIAQRTGAADLIDVYRLARANDPTFQAAEFTLTAASQKEPQAFSALLPAISANGNYSWTHGSTAYTGTPQVNRGFDTHDWEFRLTQPIFRAQNWIAYGESHAVVAQAVAQYAAAEQDLLLRTAQAYFEVVVSGESVAAADSQVAAFTEQLKSASRSFQAGVSSITDVHDATSREALAEAQREAAKADLEGKRATFEAIVGEAPPSLAVLKDGVEIPPADPGDSLVWIERALADSPQVRAARAAEDIAGHELSRARAQRLPSLDLTASYGANYSSGNIVNPSNYATDVRDRQVTLQFSMPLLDAGALHSQVTEARALHRKAIATLEAVRRQATVDTRQAFAALTSGRIQIRALEAALVAGRSAVKGNQAGYGLGIRINSDVLNAQQQLYATQRDYAKARYDTLLQELKLKAAAGALTEADLRDVNRLFEEHPVGSPNR